MKCRIFVTSYRSSAEAQLLNSDLVWSLLRHAVFHPISGTTDIQLSCIFRPLETDTTRHGRNYSVHDLVALEMKVDFGNFCCMNIKYEEKERRRTSIQPNGQVIGRGETVHSLHVHTRT